MRQSDPRKTLADRSGPTRMCIACGLKTDSHRLVRMVRRTDGSVTPDWRRDMQGRGAHLCLATKCLNSAFRRRLFDRAFRTEVAYSKLASLLEAFDRMSRVVESGVTDGGIPCPHKTDVL